MIVLVLLLNLVEIVVDRIILRQNDFKTIAKSKRTLFCHISAQFVFINVNPAKTFLNFCKKNTVLQVCIIDNFY